MAIDSSTVAAAARPIPSPPSPPLQAPTGYREEPAEVAEGSMSFWDLLDVVNPLQHIPVVGTLYRAATGDEIGAPARVMGGILFGGVIGGLAAVANAVMEETTGKDAGDHVLTAMGFQDDGATPAGTATVLASNPAPTPADPAQGTAPSGAVPTPGANAATVSAPDPAARLASEAASTAAAVRMGDPFSAAPGEHRPSRMPARDTVLANTALARHTAALVQNPPAGPSPKATAPMHPAPTAAAVAAQAPPSAPAPPTPAPPEAAFPEPVSKEALSEVMLRNLAKYEQARKAAQRTPPGVQVSG